jgi:hypothetical protein
LRNSEAPQLLKGFAKCLGIGVLAAFVAGYGWLLLAPWLDALVRWLFFT